LRMTSCSYRGRLEGAITRFRGVSRASCAVMDEIRGAMHEFFLERGLASADSRPADLCIREMSGAMSNFVLALGPKEDAPLACILRIYGGEHAQLFDREEELAHFRALAEAGVGPELMDEFEGGRIERFVGGEPLTPESMRSSESYLLVASALAEFHAAHVERPRKDVAAGLRRVSDVDAQALLMGRLHSWLEHARSLLDGERADVIGLSRMPGALLRANDLLSGLELPSAFCHNDLQCGNILMCREGGRATGVQLIDFEYARYNYCAFDLANHFMEWCYDYRTSDGCKPDRSRYPDKGVQQAFLRSYLGPEASEGDVEVWLHHVRLLTPLTHLWWTLWAAVEAASSSVDFDYVAYGRARFALFEEDMGTAEATRKRLEDKESSE